MAVRRRVLAGFTVAAFAVLPGCSPDTGEAAAPRTPAQTDRPVAGTNTPAPSKPASPAAPARQPSPTRPALPPSPERKLSVKTTITGDIQPKSVVASGTGLFFAQNMMYRHTITVYDRDHELVATISDSVDLAALGVDVPSGTVRGAPVEAAFTPDGRYGYVSNYSMSGPGFGPEGSDSCSPESGYDDSFVYRIDVAALRIDQAIRVGAVPKYVAVSPDGRWVLVTNWCSYTISVIDAATGAQVRELDVGRYPRGIAVAPDSSTAYVAVMGGTHLVALDLSDFTVRKFAEVGANPRHLVIDSAGRFLYVTLNGEGTVAKVDVGTGDVVDEVSTGRAPRSMTIAPDDLSLYVVNYNSDTVSKVRTTDMTELQELPTGHHPIGITVDAHTAEVWVACYAGSIMVFRDA